MQISIGWTAKRLNSTSTKFTKVYENVEVTLKEPTSIQRPVFLLKLKGPADIHKCNYLYYLKWGYYWIDDIVVETNDLVTISCHRDVLATFKNLISQTETFVNYCSLLDDYSKGQEIDDPRLTADIQYAYHEYYPISSLYNDIRLDYTGCFLLKTLAIGARSGAGSHQVECGINTYLMDRVSFQELCGACADELIQNVADAARYLLGENPKENILKAAWVPWNYSDCLSTFESYTTFDVNMAGFETSLSNKVIMFPSEVFIWNGSGSVNLDIASNTTSPLYPWKFLAGSKYTSVQLVHPGGTFDLSSDDLININQLNYKISLDFTSGDYAIQIIPAGITGDGTNGLSGISYPVISGSMAVDMSGYLSSAGNPDYQIRGLAVEAIGNLGSAAVGTLGIPVGEKITTKQGANGDYYAVHRSGFNISTNRLGESYPRGVTGISGYIASLPKRSRPANACIDSSLVTCYASVPSDQDISHMFRIEVSTYTPHVFSQDYTDRSVSYYASFGEKYGFPYFADTVISLLKDPADPTRPIFVQCAGFNLLTTTSSTPVTLIRSPYPNEIAEINHLMNNGVYLE